MEKKSTKGIIIALCTVIVVLIGSITYMFMSGTVSFNTKKQENNKTEEKETSKKEDKEEIKEEQEEKEDVETTEMSLTDPTVERLYSMIKDDSDFFQTIEREFYSKDSYTRKEVSDSAKLWLAFKELGENKFKYSYKKTDPFGNEIPVYVLDSNVVMTTINKLFGPENGYSHTTIYLDTCQTLLHNKETQKYELFKGNGCGGTMVDFINTKLVKAEQKNDTIILTEKMYLYVLPEKKVYKDLNSKYLIAENIDETKSFEDLKSVDEFFEQGATMKYTFKLAEDGSYYFDNSKLTY